MITPAIALLSVALSGLVLVDWATSASPRTALPGTVVMQPLTALGFILAGCGLAAAHWNRSLPRLAGAGAVLMIGLASLAEYAFALQLGLERLLFADKVLGQDPAPLRPGLPTPLICVMFVLLGAALLLAGARDRRQGMAAVVCASLAALIAILSLLAYLIHFGEPLRVLRGALGVPILAALMGAALAGATLMLRRDLGWVRLLAEGGEQARIARLLAPIALIPVAAAFVANLGVRQGFYGPDVRMLLITELSATTLLLLSLWAASHLGRERGKLRESQDRLAQAVAAYGLGIFDYHPRTGQIVFSAEMETILGLEPGGLHGDFETWLGYMLPDDLERNRTESALAVEQQLPKRNYHIKVRRPDGEVRDLQGIVRYIYGEDGQPDRVIGINMDVTDQVRDREALAARDARLMELQSELTHVSRLSAMGEMASALAHELNQPLTAAGNFLGAIEMSLGEEGRTPDPAALTRIRRTVRLASAQALRAGEIVRRLREFIARGEADTCAEDLPLLIDDAIALVAPSARAAEVEIRRDLPGRQVLVDRVQVQQVLVNLFRNAVEAMRDQDGPRVLTVRAVRKGAMAEISVADTGPGVPPAVAAMLFTPFMSTKGAGMGVGLSICRRIIEAHGGEMWLEQGSVGGADFRFTLPLMEGKTQDDGRE